MSFKDVQAIFFDTSDTLYTSDAMEAAYLQTLIDMLARDRQMTAGAAQKLFAETAKTIEARAGHATKVGTMAELGYTRSQVHEGFNTVRPNDYLAPNPELAAMMQELSKNYQLGIISNLQKVHVLEVLQALGVPSTAFSLFVTEDIVTAIKPDPEPFLKAVELARCTPSQCLYVGDSPAKDMKPAKGVGMVTVLVAASCPEDYRRYVDAVIPNVTALTALLQ